ncbi:MAG: response regulator [Kiritimatiellales bacterium]|nr:response regulator [Kiritimatiellota bacterium]MBL7012411.1 response regulator [Kiritimatiellales bacterium]
MNTQTGQRNKPRIVVADDDVTVRMLARECLEPLGFDVEEAGNGREAIERIFATQPDAVMLDVLMPEIDGYEVCRAIRKIPGNESLPILMMTALEDEESINEAYMAGASEFTTKPVNWTVESYRLKNMLRFAEASRQIELARQEWERTFNALDELVIVYDADMNIVQANHAAIAATKTGSRSIRGKNCADVFCSSETECATCPIKAALRRGEKITMEWPAACFDGTFLVSVIPIFDSGENPAQAVCLAKDITERKQMDNELRCAQKMDAIGTLSGGLAHDFNNLLQIIIGYAEMGLEETAPEEHLFRNLDGIYKAAARGKEITKQLMAVSRNVESSPIPAKLNQAVEEVASLLERTFPKMIAIERDLAPRIQWVNADVAQIEQVLMNLAVNAKHAMPQGGKLYFETRNIELDEAYCRIRPNMTAGPYVMLSVTDTGCGINEDIRERIFEPFFTTRDSEEGSGLGLTMVYGIVQKHNGHTLIYSEEGVGTTVKVYLPAIEKEGQILEPDDSIESMLVGGDETILLVDDEADIRNIAKNILLRAGYRVLAAVNGQEALNMVAAEEIDLIVLDLNMPVMGGLECLDQLRESGSNISVLLASGFALSDESRKRLSDTVNYLNKPYQFKELLYKVHDMLRSAKVGPE